MCIRGWWVCSDRELWSSHTHCEGLEQYYFYFLNLPISIILLRTKDGCCSEASLSLEKTCSTDSWSLMKDLGHQEPFGKSPGPLPPAQGCGTHEQTWLHLYSQWPGATSLGELRGTNFAWTLHPLQPATVILTRSARCTRAHTWVSVHMCVCSTGKKNSWYVYLKN